MCTRVFLCMSVCVETHMFISMCKHLLCLNTLWTHVSVHEASVCVHMLHVMHACVGTYGHVSPCGTIMCA